MDWARRCGFAGLILAAGLVTAAVAQIAGDPDPDSMAALNARAAQLDSEDYQFMQPVCTRCHTPSMILHSRTWSDWQSVFNQMKGYGAEGTPEQWDHIRKFVQHSLTLLDVNHADEDELSAVLGVDEKTAILIVQRRVDRRFDSAQDLESVPGLDKALVEAIKPRLSFDRPQEEQ